MFVDEDISDFLSHHGIKGQRWGVRNKQTGTSTKKVSRRQRRIAATHANQRAAKAFVVKASKNPNMIVLLNGRHVITGKQFVDHMMAGGLMDIKTTGELKF